MRYIKQHIRVTKEVFSVYYHVGEGLFTKDISAYTQGEANFIASNFYGLDVVE